MMTLMEMILMVRTKMVKMWRVAGGGGMVGRWVGWLWKRESREVGNYLSTTQLCTNRTIVNYSQLCTTTNYRYDLL